MGIMNKMKTVDLGTLNWEYSLSVGRMRFKGTGLPIPRVGVVIEDKPRAYCSLYKVISQEDYQLGKNGLYLGTADNSDTVFVSDPSFNDVASFTQHLQDENAMLTYETIDSVEEEIVSYHPQQLLINGSFENGINHWIVYSGTYSINSATGTLTLTNAAGRDGIKANRDIPLKQNHKYAAFITHKNSQLFQMNTLTYQPDYHNLPISTSFITDGWITTVQRSDETVNFDIFPSISGEVGTIELRGLMIVDLTELYGAGNEPSSVATFLSQHPEYSSYVPHYDGEIHIAESIMNKMKTVNLGTLNWAIYRDRSSETPPKYTYIARISDIQPSTTNIYSDSLHFVNGAWGVGDINSMAVSGRDLYVVSDILNNPTAFKQAMQGVILTYETVDGVEE